MLLYVSANISPSLAPIISFMWNLFIISDVLKLNTKTSKCKLYFDQHRYSVFLAHLNSIPILRPLGYKTLGSYRGQSQHAKIASIASHWKWLNISSTPLKGRCIAQNSNRRSLRRSLSPPLFTAFWKDSCAPIADFGVTPFKIDQNKNQTVQ